MRAAAVVKLLSLSSHNTVFFRASALTFRCYILLCLALGLGRLVAPGLECAFCGLNGGMILPSLSFSENKEDCIRVFGLSSTKSDLMVSMFTSRFSIHVFSINIYLPLSLI